MTYTDADKLDEIEREIAISRRVYPGLVAQHKLSYASADRQLAILVRIADDYRTRVKQSDMAGA